MEGMEEAIIALCPNCEEEQEVEVAVRKTVCRVCGKLFDLRENSMSYPGDF